MMNNYILQIDTATEICSVSISLNGSLVGKIDATELNVHASQLTVYIDQLLTKYSLNYSDLAAIAVSMGPGSYTGLRIGVSAAKGLCYALDIPLVAINTLESMFQGFSEINTLSESLYYIPMLDARRMEVYQSVFDYQKNLILSTAAVIVEEETYTTLLPHSVCLFGSGAAKLKTLFQDSTHVHIDDSYRHSSSSMCQLAFYKFENNLFEDIIYFEPYYLKEFIATTPKKPILG